MFLALLVVSTFILTAVLIATTPDHYNKSLQPKTDKTPVRSASSPKSKKLLIASPRKTTRVEMHFGESVTEEEMALATDAMVEAVRRAEEDTRRAEDEEARKATKAIDS